MEKLKAQLDAMNETYGELLADREQLRDQRDALIDACKAAKLHFDNTHASLSFERIRIMPAAFLPKDAILVSEDLYDL